MQQSKPDLTGDPIIPMLAKLTWPMTFGMLGSVLYNLADTYFLGKVGVDELAAMGFTFPAVMFVSIIAGGIGIGTASLFSRSVVSRSQSVVQSYSMYVFILSFLSIAVFIAAGLFTLDPLLIFGWGPFPEMGLRGAALATAISMAMSCFLSLYILICREQLLALTRPVFKEMIKVWKQVLYIGLPAAMATLITPLSIGFITRIHSGFGTDDVAAFGVVSRLEMFAFTLVYALCSVLKVFAGQNWSAGKPIRLRKGINISAVFSLGIGIFFL